MSSESEQVRRRAYEIWEAEGRPSGKDQEHWEQARRQLEGEAQGRAAPAAAAELPAVKGRRTRGAQEGAAGTEKKRRAAPRKTVE